MSKRASKTKQTELSRRQKRALVAVAESTSIAAASAACGIPSGTIRRWLSTDKNFANAVTELQERATEEAFGHLSSRALQAVECLLRNLSCGVAGVEVRAALGYMGLLAKRAQAAKYDRMEQEIERLAASIEVENTQKVEVI